MLNRNSSEIFRANPGRGKNQARSEAAGRWPDTEVCSDLISAAGSDGGVNGFKMLVIKKMIFQNKGLQGIKGFPFHVFFV